jgi:uncharacterized protein
MSEALDLWDYRRRVHAMYTEARSGGEGKETWSKWIEAKDALFASHPQTPLEDTSGFTGLPYFDHDPAWRVDGVFIPHEDEPELVGHSGEGATRFIPIGTIAFESPHGPGDLTALWLDAYGGGLFLPFRDATSGESTYGGGRYLLDTVKGADLGHVGERLVLDFNYAYHPSCVHAPRWSCPLAPPANRLAFPVEAGERMPPDHT